jgi:ribonucleoside-diphosphate reductase alpha chain
VIRGSVYDPDNLRWTPPQPLIPYTRLEKWGRPSLDWDAVVEDIRRHGIRNAAQTTVAPTGTVATVSGCEAYGCEPVFALAYVRHVNDDGRDMELWCVSPLFLRALEEAGLDDATRSRS